MRYLITLLLTAVTCFGQYLSPPDFDGSTGYLEISQSDDLEFGASTDFSISCWVNLTDKGGNQYITGYGDRDGSGDGWTLYHIDSDEKVYFAIESGGTQTTIVSANSIPFDEWVHLVVVCDRDGNAELFIDGSSSVTGDISSVGDINHATLRDVYFGTAYF